VEAAVAVVAVRLAARLAVRPLVVVAVAVARPADARRAAAVRLSAAASRLSSVRAGPDPAGPGQRRGCRRWPPHGRVRWLVRATAWSRSPSLLAGQHQFASSENFLDIHANEFVRHR
jgi:hypothetical protein